MSSPSMPPDNSMQVESMRMQEADRKEKAQAVKDAQRKSELLGLRNNAAAGGKQSARDFFTSQGLDAGRHGGEIDSQINSILSGVAEDDPNPGSYFQDAGQTIMGNLEGGYRNKAGRDLDTIFSPDFETRRLPFTVDDPYLAGIEAEQRSSADDIIRRMLDRGVITQAGFGAAEGDLDRQGAGVKSRLNEIGTGLIGTGQQDLRDVANRGRQQASTLRLDQPFLAGDFGSEVDRITSEFLSGLGTNIRSRISGNLFDTAGLGGIAGAAQGAQNTPFDPNVLAGNPDDDEQDNSNDNQDDPLF